MSMFSAETNRLLSSRLLHNLGYEQIALLEGAHRSQRLISFAPSKDKRNPVPLEDPNA